MSRLTDFFLSAGRREVGAFVSLHEDSDGKLWTAQADATSGNQIVQTVAPSTFPGIIVGGTLTRPADTTAYASGDLIANSTTAGSVVLQTFPGVTLADNGIVEIQGARLLKSGTGVTGASFAIHLFTAAPASFTNGDNGAFLCPSANYVGVIDIAVDRALTDGAFGSGIPRRGTPTLIRIPTGNALHYALEARGAYTPISGETFIPTLEIYRW